MKKIISLLAVILLITGCTKAYQTIDSNEAMELIEDGAIIIDVREKSEYEESHIEDAINIPLDSIDSISYAKDKVIIVYCATGVRSQSAANSLHKMGYTNIYNLDGGLINWGFELED